MGLIQDYFRRLRERKERKESYAEDVGIQEGHALRKLSANERELMRIQEEERQKRIKAMLDARRKEENDRIWSGKHGNPAYAKNVVAGQQNLFSGKCIFAGSQNSIAQPCIFHNQKNIFTK